MIVVGIDTATPALGVGLAGETGLIAETTLNLGLRHAQGLLPTLESLLKTADLTVGDLGAVAVTIGPGSFTAVRIGLNTAKGLCLANGLPLVGISTLAAMAARFPSCSLPVAPWLDAKRGEVYAGRYDVSGARPVALEPDAAVPPVQWLELHPGPALFVGDGAALYGDLIRERLGQTARFAPPWTPLASGGIVAVWGRERALAGQHVEPDSAAPAYLRRPQALTAGRREK
jgi:tRNA threonylcarbamoyladenosine biosynthesis protein TsaB